MLDLEHAKQRIEAISAGHRGPIGVAVSGGGDSVALLGLAADWASETSRTLLALTVDHGLRAEAHDEALAVQALCQSIGVRHEILGWSPPRKTVSQATARRARHALLASALRSAGGTHLLMGHTLDDQAETVAMRRSRPGDEDALGLAGMRELSVSPVWPEGRGIQISRPLLDIKRADLRDYLKIRGFDWVEDPSNENWMFERARVRQSLSNISAVLDKVYLAARAARKKQDGVLGQWLDTHVEADGDGLVSCQPGPLSAEDFTEGLAWLIMAAAGTDRRAQRTSRLKLADDILVNPKNWRARTLGGAWIAPRKGCVHIARDPGAVTDKAGAQEVWDGRFCVDKSVYAVASGDAEEAKTVLLASLAPMARSGWPPFANTRESVRCLVPDRLRDIKTVLCYESLMA